MFFSNFAGSFWANFRSQNSSRALLSKLENPETTLEDIMLEDDLLQEMKFGNEKLLNLEYSHSFNFEKLEKLIGYITLYPSEDLSEEEIHKFPFIAGELFTCNYPAFLDKIISEPALISELLRFLKYQPLDITLAGYFSKAFTAILNRNYNEVMKILSEENYYTWFFTNFEVESVAIAVESILVRYDENQSHLVCRLHIVEFLVLALENYCSMSSSKVIVNILRKKEIPDWEKYLEILTKEDNFRIILDEVSGPHEQQAKDSSIVLLEILKSNIQLNLDLISYLIYSLEAMTDVLYENTELFQESTSGFPILVLGERKILLTEIFIQMVYLEHPNLDEELSEQKLVEIMTILFFRHEQNSIFHGLFYKFITTIVNSESFFLKRSLFSSNIFELLVEAPQACSGITGTVKLLANFFHTQSEFHPELFEALNQCEIWSSFFSKYIMSQNELENRKLGKTTSLFIEEKYIEDDLDFAEPDESFEQTIEPIQEEIDQESFNEVDYWRTTLSFPLNDINYEELIFDNTILVSYQKKSPLFSVELKDLKKIQIKTKTISITSYIQNFLF